MFEVGTYEIIEVIHIAAVISWMAGLLYLPRIYVYHADAKIGSEMDQTFQIMERKLLKFIMNPAMITAFLCGAYMASHFGLDTPWLHAKLFFVLLLAGFHGFLASSRKKFALGQNKKSAKFYRMINEIPALIMIIIIALVVIKPF